MLLGLGYVDLAFASLWRGFVAYIDTAAEASVHTASCLAMCDVLYLLRSECMHLRRTWGAVGICFPWVKGRFRRSSYGSYDHYLFDFPVFVPLPHAMSSDD